MKTAAQLTRLIKRYAQIPAEVKLLKESLLETEFLPGNDIDFEKWKEERAREKDIPNDYPPPRNLSSNPTYHAMINLYEEMVELAFQITGTADYDRARTELMSRIMWSFPSLRGVVVSGNSTAALYDFLADDEPGDDPQAYYAALFVLELDFGQRGYVAGYPRFYLDRAFEVWDDEHKDAFVHWTTMPFFPRGKFQSLARGPFVL